jgi:hypothetical protein
VDRDETAVSSTTPGQPSSPDVSSARVTIRRLRSWVQSLLGVLGIVLLGVLGLTLLNLAFAPTVFEEGETLLKFLTRQLGSGLIVAIFTSVLLSIFFQWSQRTGRQELEQWIREDVTKDLNTVKNSIGEQTRKLFEASASLEAIHTRGIFRLYGSRATASADIARSLTDPNVCDISLLGVSLNDFVHGHQENLNRAWSRIEAYIRSGRDKSHPPLTVRILLIHPDCLGSELRSKGESREPGVLPTRLSTDVHAITSDLWELEKYARDHHEQTRVCFSFRLYLIPPTFFVCSTEAVSYVQPYYFWPSRSMDVPVPVIGCRDIPNVLESSNLHQGMKSHFNWI